MYCRNVPNRSHGGTCQSRYPPSIRAQIRYNWVSIVLGSVIFITGMSLLFWNEGRAIHSARALDEALSTVIPLRYDFPPKEKNNGHLVHIIGPLAVSEPLTEVEYGVAVAAVKLKRRVQMYQWVEQQAREFEQNEYSLASYSYLTEWRDKLIDSNKFYQKIGHQNPTDFPLRSTVYISEEVTVGYFFLGQELKEKFSNFVLVTSDERPDRRDIKMHSGLYYHSQDVWNPEVGDIRIQFSYAGKAGEVVTVVGMQVGSKIEPYHTSAGKEVLFVCEGALSVEEIFTQEHAQNIWLTWIFRCLGWIIMYQGSSCFAKLFRIFFGRYSVLREVLILGFGSISAGVSLSAGLLVFACAWIWYRPLFGLSVACTAMVPVLYGTLKLYIKDYYDNQYKHLHSH